MNESKAIGYTRVSPRDQAADAISLVSQRRKIEAYAVLHELELVEVIEDAGYSAKSLDRPGMAVLLRLIRGRKVGVVVIAKLDRITRSVRDLGDLVELFQRSGVEFASVADHIDTSTASGRLVLNVMGSVSQWEREAIGERTSEALAVMRSNGRRISRHAPYGYRLNSQGWIEDEHEQRAISLMRQLRGDGLSLRQIAAELDQQGHRNRRGRRLSAQTIANVLKRD
ncbi:MAG: recombinase family protein [Phycisphaerales bacterium]